MLTDKTTPDQPLSAAALAVLCETPDKRLFDVISGGTQEGDPFLPAHNAIKQANHCFGFGGWSHTIDEIALIDEQEPVEKNGRLYYLITYSARVTVTAGGCQRGGAGVRESRPQPTRSGAIQEAYKGAVSMAMKDALRSFGQQFGLHLRNERDPYGEQYMAQRYGLEAGMPDPQPPTGGQEEPPPHGDEPPPSAILDADEQAERASVLSALRSMARDHYRAHRCPPPAFVAAEINDAGDLDNRTTDWLASLLQAVKDDAEGA